MFRLLQSPTGRVSEADRQLGEDCARHARMTNAIAESTGPAFTFRSVVGFVNVVGYLKRQFVPR
jgi:hypothetical protein